jgi:hypothetical protein
MNETYDFDDDSYLRIAAAGVDWRDVVFVLHDSRPFVRRHVGAVANIAARDRRDAWLAVAAIELDDDHYLVVGARYLDADETASIIRILKGQL